MILGVEVEIEASREEFGPLNKNLLYVQAERSIEDLLVRRRYKAGDRISPEADLA